MKICLLILSSYTFLKKFVPLGCATERENYGEPGFNLVVTGINRAIKGLKWQAYGYKDMLYFVLKIMQKVGYLNHQYIYSQT